MNYEELEIIHKSKADTLVYALEEKRKIQHKIEFYVKNRYHAVYLTEIQLLRAEEKSKLQGISITQLLVNKYSK